MANNTTHTISYVADYTALLTDLQKLEAIHSKEADRISTAFSKALKFSPAEPLKVDTSKIKKELNDVNKLTEQIAKAMGRQVADAFKPVRITSITAGQIKTQKIGGDQVITQEFITKFRDANNKLQQFNATIAQTGNGFKILKPTMQSTLSLWGQAGKDILELGRRAILTVPIWTLMRNAIMSVFSSLWNAGRFLIDWEKQMAEIQVASGATAGELKSLSTALLDITKNYGIANEAVGTAAKTWIQQGRAISEIIPLMNATAKLSLLTGQSTTQSVEDLTAVLKAYSIEAKDAINIIDAITNVELVHAVTTRDLVNAYKVVGSSAAQLGVDLNTLTGFITAIKSETRDTGSVVGRVLRTAFSRLATDQAKNVQELTGVALFMDEFGKATTRVTPTLRPLGDSINEIALKFNDLGNAQQAQLAKLIGGVRNQNQIIALFKNYDEAIQASIDSLFAFGKADTATNVLLETTAQKIGKLSGSWFSFVDAIGNTSWMKGAIDSLAGAFNGLTRALTDATQVQLQDTQKKLISENDEYSRQITLLNNIILVKNKVGALSDVLARNPEKLALITKQVKAYVQGINSVANLTGIQIDAGIESPDKLVAAIDLVKEKIDGLKESAQDKQAFANFSIQANSIAAQIAKISNLSRFDKVNRMSFVNTDDVKRINETVKAAKDGLSSLKNLDPSKTLDFTALEQQLKKLLAPAVFKEAKNQLNNLIVLQKQFVEGKNQEKLTQQAINDLNREEQDLLTRQKVSEVLLKNELDRYKLLGATTLQALKYEESLRTQLGLEETSIKKLERQLQIEQEKSKEKRLQGKLGSTSIQLFEVAKKFGVDVAKEVGDAIQGNRPLEWLSDKGLEAFKTNFADLYNQIQAEKFFKGQVVEFTPEPSTEAKKPDYWQQKFFGDKPIDVPIKTTLSGGFQIPIDEEALRASTSNRELLKSAELAKSITGQGPLEGAVSDRLDAINAMRQVLLESQKQPVNMTANVQVKADVNLDGQKVGDFAVDTVNTEVLQEGSEIRRNITNAVVEDAGLQ